jgi:hypothetical protein|mmetsp:Transcript_55805/g.88440  ORF Transcript_55805/g.88440 Transcript_55805/m.88440 type:complete len:296 (+) Transcript_55805:107-994(+)
MSDEDVLGTVCYIPSRVYVGLLALGFTLYGCYQSFYYILFFYAIEGKMTPNHCSGSACEEVFSCRASLNASNEVYKVILVVGSLVCGFNGINAMMNRYPSDTYNFGCWLVAVVALCAFVTMWDFLYAAACGGFSYNVISQVILWNIPHLLVNEGVKYEVRQLNAYPRAYINALAGMRVFPVYLFLQLVKILFFVHGAWVTFLLAQRYQYGIAGMGATFSIEGWRKRLQARDEITEVVQNTWDMAKLSAMDLEWDREDLDLRRPLRQGRHWYRGFVPGAAARAYDGFRDDRRNVLL